MAGGPDLKGPYLDQGSLVNSSSSVLGVFELSTATHPFTPVLFQPCPAAISYPGTSSPESSPK